MATPVSNRKDPARRAQSLAPVKRLPGKTAPPELRVIPNDASAQVTITTAHRFETEEAAAREDRRRARQMRRVLRVMTRLGPTNWTNLKDRLWLARQNPFGRPKPMLRPHEIRRLAERLEDGVASGLAPATLGSSLRMRLIRQAFHRALFDAFALYSDHELRTVTVIYSGWAFSTADLDGTTAAKLKQQFRQHLNRIGVMAMLGPLIAVLHGEFDPTSGRYQVHFHVATTAAKAAAMKAGLRAQTLRGYTATATGASPVRVSQMRDRARQFTYLTKSYWPSRPVVMIAGRPKRVRDGQRIPEPFHTQVHLWLDRQRFADLVLMTDCWSMRRGGSAVMKRLYLFVMGVG